MRKVGVAALEDRGRLYFAGWIRVLSLIEDTLYCVLPWGLQPCTWKLGCRMGHILAVSQPERV